MKIYTKTGDHGETGLFGGLRVSKDHAVIQACGDVDETNCALALARSLKLTEPIDLALNRVQEELFVIGSQIANCQSSRPDPVTIDQKSVSWLEARIDQFNDGLPELRAFVLPGGIQAASQLHVARSVCRRAERSVVTLVKELRQPSELSRVVVYLNRLSDFLFVTARQTNFENKHVETAWLPEKRD